MSLSMHSTSVPTFSRTLTAMSQWLDAAEAHAKEHGFEANNYLGLRLAPDMAPFSRQIQFASDGAKNCVARLAGLEPPKWADDEASIDELRARIAKTIEYVNSVSAEQIDGSEAREIVMQAGPDRSFTFTGEDFLRGFSLPNFFFHATMTYALLRQGGVKLGKMDFLGAP
jgi:hypothetical protein